MRIAITGYRGFIGSAVSESLKFLGHDVIHVEGDLKYANLPLADGYMHFAAKMGGVEFFNSNQFDPILENISIDSRIINHCKKNSIRLFYPSSACIYPVHLMNKGELLTEDMIWGLSDPDQMYGFEKLFITRLANYSDFDMRVGILHTIYGDGQSFLGNRAKFPPQICHKFCLNEPVEVWGNGFQTRTFLNINDAVQMINEVFLADYYNGPVNISHPDEVSVKSIVDLLSKYTSRFDVFYNVDKPVGPVRRPVSMKKYNSIYKYRPKTDYSLGFVSLYESIKHKTVDVNSFS
jgi:nucleoside-diphosphate-sugar epimerase